jgi:hypothetical protein
MPSLRKTSSKAPLNLLSRSWIRKRIRSKTPVKLRLRACWVTQAPVGLVVQPVEVDAAAFEFDEEEHVEAAQRDRLDGEEVAGEHAGGLLAEEFAPARSRAPRRGPKTAGEQDAPDRARRHAQAELQQLAGDPRVAPARVLPCEAHDKLTDAIIDGRTAGASTRLRPLAADELPVPAQERLWRHDQAASALPRQDSRQRGKEGAIGRPQPGAPLLPPEYDELMSQHEQLDVFGELAAAAADQQTQHSPEGEIGEGKEHAPDAPIAHCKAQDEQERRSWTSVQ